MSELKISKEFLEENKSNLSQFMPKTRRRGPYSKQEKESRRNEVYRLHFDYGYSARKISESISAIFEEIEIMKNEMISRKSLEKIVRDARFSLASVFESNSEQIPFIEMMLGI